MVCDGACMGRTPRNETLTLTRCHNCVLPQLYESPEGWKSVRGQMYILKALKGKMSVFLSYLAFLLSTVAHFMMRADPNVAR